MGDRQSMRKTLPVRPLASLLCAFIVVRAQAAARADTFTWKGGDGNWNVRSNWIGNRVPGMGSIVLIDNGNPIASMVVLNVNAQLVHLTIDSDDSLTVAARKTLAIENGGNITNMGTIMLDAGNGGASLQVRGVTKSVSLDGGGTLILADSPQTILNATQRSDFLINVDNTIRGAGQIGAGTMGFDNQGAVLADGVNDLVIQPSTSGFSNEGTLQVAGGSRLIVTGPRNSFTNFSSSTSTLTGGVYVVGGTLQFDNAHIVTNAANITLDGSGAQIVDPSGNNALRDFVVNAPQGLFTVQNGAAYGIGSEFVNEGALVTNSGGTLTLSNGTLHNNGGFLLALDDQGTGSSIVLTNETIEGGYLNSDGNGVIENSSTVTLNGRLDPGVTNGGTYVQDDGTTTTLIGSIHNSGSIVLNSAGLTTTLQLAEGDVTLDNGGTIALSNANSRIVGTLPTDLLFNVDNTIQGAGQIGAGKMGLINGAAATIDANLSGQTLTVQPEPAGAVNLGTLQASNGGTLLLLDGTFDNTGGTIQALDSSQVSLHGALVTGGVIDAASGGTLEMSGAVIRDASVNTMAGGTFHVDGGAVSRIEAGSGAFSNAGTVQVDAGSRLDVTGAPGSFTNFSSSTSTLTGGAYVVGGTFQFDNAHIVTNAADITLDGPSSQIVDQFGNNALQDFVVNASGASFTVQNGREFDRVGDFFNAGTLTANSGGLLSFSNGTLHNSDGILQAMNNSEVLLNDVNVTNSGGLLQALDGSQVRLDRVTISGGTLATGGSGVIHNVSSATLDNLTNAGTFVQDNGTTTTLIGIIHNSGSIVLNSSNLATTLQLAGGDVTLSNGGTITLSNPNSRIVGSHPTDVLFNEDNTIQGAGQIGAGTMGLINGAAGRFDANLTGQTLTVQPEPAGAVNLGTLQAGNGGILLLHGAYDNTGGTIQALDKSEVRLDGANITGGTLATGGSGFIHNISSTILSNLTNAGTYVQDDGTITTLIGSINNAGSISLNSAGQLTRLFLNGSVSLHGGGTITLSDSFANTVFSAHQSDILTNVDNTIQGAGQIGLGSMGFVNQGTVLANGANPLEIACDSSGFSNEGTLQVADGSLLIVAGALGSFTNFSSSTATLTGGTYIVGGTFRFTDANIVTNAANITLRGPSSQIVDQFGNDALAGFNHNAPGARFSVEDREFDRQNDFTNGGLMRAGAGGTLLFSGPNVANVDGASPGLILADTGQVAFTQTTVTGGTVAVAGAGSVVLTNATLQGGALTNSSTGTIVVTGGSQNSFDGTLTNPAGGQVVLQDGSTLQLHATGTYNNGGTIALNSAGSATTLLVAGGTVRLTGGGTVLLSNSPTNIITGLTPQDVLNNVDNTIVGSGQIGNGNMGLLNGPAGTIHANQSTPLVINSSAAGVHNDGTFQVDAGSTLVVTGLGPGLDNYTPATKTLTGGTYLVAGTLHLDNAVPVDVATLESATLVLDGPSSQVLNRNGADALTHLARVEPAGPDPLPGRFSILNGRDFNTLSKFSNGGEVTIGVNSTMHVQSGAGDYTQTAGITTVDGTLQAVTVHVNAGTLEGTGTIEGDVTNQGTVHPGDDPGTLTIKPIQSPRPHAGNYAQGPNGIFSVELGGYHDGVDSSLLAVLDGNITLDGTVDVSLFGDFAPQRGDEFTIITYGDTRFGTFSAIDSLNPGYSYAVEYEPGRDGPERAVELAVTGTPSAPATPDAPGWLLFLSGGAALALRGCKVLRKEKTP